MSKTEAIQQLINYTTQNYERSAADSWKSCLEYLRQSIDYDAFQRWFEPIIPESFQNKILTIQIPSREFYEKIEGNYVEQLRKALDYSLGKDTLLEYSLLIETHKNTSPQKPTVEKKYSYEAKVPSPQTPSNTGLLSYETYINPQYTFDTFVEGTCNRLVRLAGLAIAEKPGITSFNPLMIYGGVGLGKTHLAQAIGNYVNINSPQKKVVYVSSEKFTNQFVHSLKTNALTPFTDYYLATDVLIIDDIQFFSGKERTQETFFHIFNHLHQTHKQIIMTSDRSPKELEGFEDRLLSRFKWGLTADLQMPDFETRKAIIQKKTELEKIIFPPEVLDFIAHSIDTNVRELEGVVVYLIAQSTLLHCTIDLAMTKLVISNVLTENNTHVSIDLITKCVSEAFEVKPEDLNSKKRTKELVLARQIVMYLAKEYTDLSLKLIGYQLGKRDHTTVIYGIQNMGELLLVNEGLRQKVDKLKVTLGKNNRKKE